MIVFFYNLETRIYRAIQIGLVILCTMILVPNRASAQWPPFEFKLEPSFEEGQITYRVKFSSQVDWTMTDVIFKIPLPEGTRFLEAGAPPTTRVDFDGAEITFFTVNFNQKSIEDAFFVVELEDPALATVATHAWIAWKGEQPGEYLTEDMSVDLTKKPLNWQRPDSRLQLEASATVDDDVITYTVYPMNVGRLRMWDLKINVPLPEGTLFLSAEAPAPFVTDFDGREVSFSIIEMERDADIGPLSLKVTTNENTAPSVVTHAWATWKNVGEQVGQDVLAIEDRSTGDIIVQPHATQRVVSDVAGDVPFSNYDLTSVTLQEDDPALKVIFRTAGDMGPVGTEPLEYTLYIDRDCEVETGLERKGRGVEHRVRYRSNRDRLDIHSRDETEQMWQRFRSSEEVNKEVDGNMVAIWLPGDLLENDRHFCWLAEASNRSRGFSPNPPTERVPDSNSPRFAEYEMVR